MIVEAAQWILLTVLAVLMVGILRQLALAQPVERRANVASGPRVGHSLPRIAQTAVIRATRDQVPLTRGLVVGFVIESCVACQQLLANLSSDSNGGIEDIVLVARHASPQFRAALQETSIPVVYDEGAIWEACHVSNTPLLVRIDEDGKVISKEVTHDIARVALATA